MCYVVIECSFIGIFCFQFFQWNHDSRFSMIMYILHAQKLLMFMVAASEIDGMYQLAYITCDKI